MNERSRIDRAKATHYANMAMPVAYTVDELVDALEDCVLPDPRIARIEALHIKREGVTNDVCDECSRIAAWASEDVYAEMPWPCSTADVLRGDA